MSNCKSFEAIEKAFNQTTTFPSITEHTNGCYGCCKKVETYWVKNPEDGITYPVEPEDMDTTASWAIRTQDIKSADYADLHSIAKILAMHIDIIKSHEVSERDEVRLMCLRAELHDVCEEVKARYPERIKR